MQKRRELGRIVFFPSVRWESLYQRPHHIASRLCNNSTIIWINRPQFLLKIIYNALFRRRKLICNLRDNKFYVLETFNLLPFSRFKIIKRINQVLWLVFIRTFAFLFSRFFNGENMICYICFPLPFVPFKKAFIVYDRYDRFYEFKEREHETFINDKKLMQKANLVINSSQALFRESIKYNKNSVLVRNGVDLLHFSKVRYFKKQLKRKVIGYMGGIGYWFDFDLIKTIANAYPQYEIHIIGPVRELNGSEILNLKCIKNVKFLGKVPYHELPNYIKEFDIGIIPFVVNRLTEAVDPIKLYEYIAAGKNVVTTNLPEVYRLKDYIYIAKNQEEFIKFCKEAVENPKANADLLLKVAEENTWEKRVKQIEAAINWALEKNYFCFP